MATTDSAASATVVGTRAPVRAGHTPGPWEISKTGTLPIYVAVKDGRWKDAPGTMLAEVGGNLMFGPGDFQESLANAKLIVAAPDLFDIVHDLWAYAADANDIHLRSLAERAREALLKAGDRHETARHSKAEGDRTDTSTAQPVT